MSDLRLSLGCGRYERTAALFDGRVRPRGVELVSIDLRPSDIFWRQIKLEEFDVSEMSLAAHIIATADGADRFVGIPAFPSRAFRHSAVYVRRDSELTDLGQLRGRRLGVPEYHMTAALFLRGTLADQHGIGADAVTWVQAGLEVPGRIERVELHLPDTVTLERVVGRSLIALLADGDIDALMAPSVPAEMAVAGTGAPFRRLLPDAKSVEQRYFAETGVFPIMHLVVLRRGLHEQHPWLATELLRAFVMAKQAGEATAQRSGALASVLPWFRVDLDHAVDTMGRDFWPYGIEENRATLEAACRFAHEQHLVDRRLEPEDLFVHASVRAEI